MSRWSDLADAQATAYRAKGHALLCAYAARLMPRLDDEDAKRVRAAILAGPGQGLLQVIHEINLRVA